MLAVTFSSSVTVVPRTAPFLVCTTSPIVADSATPDAVSMMMAEASLTFLCISIPQSGVIVSFRRRKVPLKIAKRHSNTLLRCIKLRFVVIELRFMERYWLSRHQPPPKNHFAIDDNYFPFRDSG